jgi:hypothetical protein
MLRTFNGGVFEKCLSSTELIFAALLLTCLVSEI